MHAISARPQPLQGRVALITGAGKGLGRAIALGLAEAGADVALLARTRSDLEAVAAQASDEGLCRPVAERCRGLQAGPATRPATQTGHLGRRAGFVEEDQAVDLLAHARLAVRLPLLTRLTHVLAPGLRGQQCFF